MSKPNKKYFLVNRVVYRYVLGNMDIVTDVEDIISVVYKLMRTNEVYYKHGVGATYPMIVADTSDRYGLSEQSSRTLDALANRKLESKTPFKESFEYKTLAFIPTKSSDTEQEIRLDSLMYVFSEMLPLVHEVYTIVTSLANQYGEKDLRTVLRDLVSRKEESYTLTGKDIELLVNTKNQIRRLTELRENLDEEYTIAKTLGVVK